QLPKFIAHDTGVVFHLWNQLQQLFSRAHSLNQLSYLCANWRPLVTPITRALPEGLPIKLLQLLATEPKCSLEDYQCQPDRPGANGLSSHPLHCHPCLVSIGGQIHECHVPIPDQYSFLDCVTDIPSLVIDEAEKLNYRFEYRTVLDHLVPATVAPCFRSLP